MGELYEKLVGLNLLITTGRTDVLKESTANTKQTSLYYKIIFNTYLYSNCPIEHTDLNGTVIYGTDKQVTYIGTLNYTVDESF